MTTADIRDLARGDTEWAQQQWDRFVKAVAKVGAGDVERLKAINADLGYPLAKAVPGLLKWINDFEEAKNRSDVRLSKAQEEASELRVEIESAKASLTVLRDSLAHANRELHKLQAGGDPGPVEVQRRPC